MPDGVSALVTGLLGADTIGVGMLAILCTGKRRQALREAQAQDEAERLAQRERKLAEMARVQARKIEAARQEAMAAHLHMHMNEQTVEINRVAWPKTDQDDPPACIRVPQQSRPLGTRPYVNNPY